MTRVYLDPVFKEICYPQLLDYISGLEAERERIAADRRYILREIASFVAGQLREEGRASLLFICTHNSRRSHFAQIWAAVAAASYGIAGLETCSGGTAVTAFNPRASAALERAGFRVYRPEGTNPATEVTWSGRRPPMICFSKVYDAPANPRNGFGAVMTCGQADQACPLIPGAEARFSLPWEDPKVMDGTEKEAARYDERCRQIAREMFFMASVVKEITG
jgi:protein-tyrosine-phosphatase